MLSRVLPPVRSPIDATMLRTAAHAVVAGGLDGAPERMLAERFGAQQALLLDSGTTALTLALRAALPEGGAVALPAFGCYDLATATLGAGITPVLYDIDPETLNPDLASVRRALRAGAGALVAYEPFGLPLELPALQGIADVHGARFIEDAAQADGCAVAGRPAGSFGDASVLSFGRGKGITVGGGGALLLRGTLADRAKELNPPASTSGGARTMLRLAAQGALGGPALYRVPASLPFLGLGETTFRRPQAPAQMDRAQRAVLPQAFDAAIAERQRRRTNAEQLLDGLQGTSLVVPRRILSATSGWLRLPVLLPPAAGWNGRRARDAKARGIVRGYPLPLSRLPGFAEQVANAETSFDGAESLAARLLTLPTHGALAPKDLDAIVRWAHRHFPRA